MFFLAAADGEDTFYLQLLVVVILAAAVGVYILAKSRAKKGLAPKLNRNPALLTRQTSHRPRAANIDLPESRTPVPEMRDTRTGMELLARDFLVDVVEKTDSADKLDISMRCMCFDELIRRNQLFALSSEALKVYVLNEGELFSKTIRLAAMAQLADRTGQIGPAAQ
jgi:hypothetical protein